MFKFLWLDTETTGLNPVKNDIIQLSGIIKSGNDEEEFDFRVQPINPDNVTEGAERIHGITKEQMMGFEDPNIILSEFKNILSKYVDPYNKKDKFVLSGQNVQFDCDFVNQFFKKLGDNYWFSWVGYSHFDLKNLAVLYEMKLGKKVFNSYKLENLCRVLNVNIGNAHNSLDDIRATRVVCSKIWKEIIGNK